MVNFYERVDTLSLMSASFYFAEVFLKKNKEKKQTLNQTKPMELKIKN